MGVGITASRAHAPSARLLQHCAELCAQSEVSKELGQGLQTPVQNWKRFADEIFFKAGKDRIGEARRILLIVGPNA